MGIYKKLPGRRTETHNITTDFPKWVTHVYELSMTRWRLMVGIAGGVVVLIAVIVGAVMHMSARDESAREALYRASVNGAGELAAYEEVFNKYSGTDAAMIARVKASDLLIEEGDMEKAEEILAPVRNKNSVVGVLALHNLAAAKLNEGKPEDAAKDYLEAFNNKKNPVRSLSYYNAALAYVSASKFDEAKKILTELSDEASDIYSPELGIKVEQDLLWLAGKTVISD